VSVAVVPSIDFDTKMMRKSEKNRAQMRRKNYNDKEKTVIQPIKNGDKVVGESFTIEISKERLRALIDAIQRECLPREASGYDSEEFVILNFSRLNNVHKVTFCQVSKETTVVLSRD